MGFEIGRKAAVQRGQPTDGPGMTTLVGIPGSEFCVWPEDKAAVPAWRLRAEDRAATLKVPLVSYRTKAEFDRALAACERRLREQMKVPPTEAAQRFVASVRSNRAVAFDNDTLAAAFADFCERVEIYAPESFVRNAMKRLPGVRREIVPTRVNGRLVREARWIIEPLRRAA